MRAGVEGVGGDSSTATSSNTRHPQTRTHARRHTRMRADYLELLGSIQHHELRPLPRPLDRQLLSSLRRAFLLNDALLLRLPAVHLRTRERHGQSEATVR